MAVSAGTATLQVAPQLVRSFSKDLATQMAGPATKTATRTGAQAGRTFGKQFGAQVVGAGGKAADDAGAKTGRRFGGKFSGSAAAGVGALTGRLRLVGPAMLAAFGGAAIISGIQDVVNEAREAAVVGRQTAAVLKSTGGAANVSAKDVERLATALSNKSGVDDEVIQTSQNLLLTFTGVRNEVGKGNDVFNQASTSIVDMTASMNGGKVTAQGLKASTIQVGKALNDPIKGMTALSRVGVTFTQGQKDQIKTLVESGDKLGAQKIILAELRKEFGGSAAASADAGKRFGVFVGNLKEQIGTALLPILNRVLGFLVDKLPGALTAIGGFFRTASLGVRALVAAFKEGDVTSDGFVGVMEQIGVVLRGVWGWIRRTATLLAGILVPAFRAIADAVRPAVAAFVGALLPGLKSLWHVIQAQVLPALKVLGIIIGVVLYGALRYVLPLLLRIAGPVLGFLIKMLGQTIQWIGNIIRFVGRVLAWLARWITGTKTTGDAIRELGRRVGVFVGNMKKQWDSITKSVGNALSWLRRTTFTVLSFMIRLWLRWAGSILDAAANAMGWVPGIGPKLRTAQAKFHDFARSVNDSLDRIRDEAVNVDVKGTFKPPKGFKLSSGRVFAIAAGGPVSGPGTSTSDSIPAMLSTGEHVWSAREVRGAGGHGVVERMRREARGYAAGGGVNVNTRLPRVARYGGAGALFKDAIGKRISKFLKLFVLLEQFGGKENIKQWIRAQDPKPYVWGAAGPNSFDCSGLVGAVYGLMRGISGAGRGKRFFTTASISTAVPGLKSGTGGTLNIGVTSGMGHMVGNYGGLGFEAESSRTGIKTGAAASPVGGFARKYHMAKGGRVGAAQALEALGIEVGGDPSRLRVVEGNKVGIFDRGGYLMPGQLGLNRTSAPERVVGPREQLIDYDRLAKALVLALHSQPLRAYANPNEMRHAIQTVQSRGGVKPANQLK